MCGNSDYFYAPPKKDETAVTYSAIDFDAMEALRKTKEEREKEVRQRIKEDELMREKDKKQNTAGT